VIETIKEDRVLKTTTKLFAASVAVALCGSPLISRAGVQSALPLLLGAASLGDDGRTAAAKADDLLREARQAMADGNLTIAESKITAAEKLQPKYPMFHAGDTPKKIRADFEKLAAQKNGARPAKPSTSAPQDPFLARGQQATDQRKTADQSTAPTTSTASGLGTQSSGLKPTNSPPAQAAPPTNRYDSQQAATPVGANPWDVGNTTPVQQTPPAIAQRAPVVGQAVPQQAAPQTVQPNSTYNRAPQLLGSQNVGPATKSLTDAASPNNWNLDAPKATTVGAAPPTSAWPTAQAATGTKPAMFDNRSLQVSNPGLQAAAAPAMYSPGTLPLDPSTRQTEPINSVNRQRAMDMTKAARAAMMKGELDIAEQIARQADLLAPDSAFAPSDDRPSFVLLEIQRAKSGGATGVVQAGFTTPATPDAGSRYPGVNAIYEPATDNSRNVLAAQTAPIAAAAPPQLGLTPQQFAQRVTANSVSPASFMPVANAEPSPDGGTGEGMRWYRQGLQSAAQMKSDEALYAFRRAYAFQTELDSITRQQLYERLKDLGERVEPLTGPDAGMPEVNVTPVTTMPPSGVSPVAGQSPIGTGAVPASAPPAKPATTATATGAFPPLGNVVPAGVGPMSPPVTQASADPAAAAMTASQVIKEVDRQQRLANQMAEKQPKQALEILQRTRAMVANASSLDAPIRESALRRLDVSIGKTQQFIAKNSPNIELTEKNKQIENDVEHVRKQRVEVQERLAYIVNDFNKAIDEQRWVDAQILAKKATELDADNPLVVQINVMAKMSQRMAQNQQLASAKEQGFMDTMQRVDEASIPFGQDFAFPDAKDWDKLSKSPFRRQKEGQAHRTPTEIEIDRRLNTPVPVKFQNQPLAQVIDYLGKIANVPTHLDPLGLQAEGVNSDTSVTIDLRQDITLKSALNLILGPLRLTYVIKNEVLLITSDDVRRGQLYTVTYPVGDLVIRIPNFMPNGNEGLNGALKAGYNVGGGGAATGPGFGFANQIAVNESGGGNAGLNPAVLAQIRDRNGFPMMGSGQTQTGTPQSIPFGPGGLKGGSQADFDSLIDLITSTIAAQTWSEVGGPGTIEGFDTNLSLVVSQTQEVHEEIADLLQQLRRLQDLQVTIEVRFITLQDDFFERIGVDFDFNIGSNAAPLPTPSTVGPPPSFGGNVSPSAVVGLDQQGSVTPGRDIQFRQGGFATALPPFGGFDPTEAATFGFAILSDIEAFFVIQAAQGDTRTNILQAPKVTLFNGQTATVSDTSQRPFVTSVIPVVGDFAAAQQPVIVVLSEGTSLTVQAVVSNDRRFVRLTVVPFFSQIGAVDEFTFTGSTSTTKKSSEDKSGDDTTGKSSDDETTTTGTTVQLPTFSFVTVTTTVSVPDGGTVLLGGIKRLSEGRNERGVPILSKLPYINRLFRNVGIGRTTSSLMMMVTPRIIIQEEEEQNLLGTTTAANP
jgi:type II secretory pathway component GspD/PulD (secretin)